MAVEGIKRHCTVVLHDDRVSTHDVLCAANILPVGFLAYLTSPGAQRLCISSRSPATIPGEVSLHVSLAQRFGFENRAKATVELIEDYDQATATHLELFFREQRMSRADLWRIMQHLDGTVVHQGQKITYLGSAAAEVKAVYLEGRSMTSAYVNQMKTRPIFRSGSARYTLLIQISKEMLECWVGAELMYERMVNGYLVELFRRWEELKVRHQVSVVLFGRSVAPPHEHALSNGGPALSAEDYFQVVISDLSSVRSSEILRKLKQVFNDIELPREVALAAKGNMLEAIHIAAMDFANDSIDPHLSSTGTSIIAITAGAGIFETSHDKLKSTTQLLMGNSIGVDIVSLSPQPLHPVPLFSYQRENVWEYALPHWVEVSFWGEQQAGFASRWLFSDSDDQVQDINLPLLPKPARSPDSSSSFMAKYDDMVCGVTRRCSATVTAAPSSSSDSAETVKATSMRSKDSNGITRAEVENSNDIVGESRPSSAALRPQPVKAPSAAQITTSRGKRTGIPAHPLLTGGRKISLGPKGLAPSRGTASISISAEHAQHGKDPTAVSFPFPSNEASSGIAKQIRLSLARKASQQSLTSQVVAINAETSKPIVIQSIQDPLEGQEDPALLIEQNVMDTVSESEMAEDGAGHSTTPRAKNDPFYSAIKAAEEEGSWMSSPWLTLLNPCNPNKRNMRVAAQYRKWQHVFPRAISSSEFKWTSMCSPATLPLTTEYRPSLRELERYPSKKVRRLLVPSSDSSAYASIQTVLEQLILLRMIHGFQVAINELSVADIDSSSRRERILVSLGNVHHELQCLSEAEIQIVEYNAEPEGDDQSEDQTDSLAKYQPRIRGTASSQNQMANLNLMAIQSCPDWSGLDDQIVSQSFMVTHQGCSKMRLVLIPIEPPHTNTAARGLSDEERHIEGIQKMTQLWQRHRYFTVDDQRHHASLVRSTASPAMLNRDPNPLAIEYQTGDQNAFVNAYGPLMTGEIMDGEPPAPLLPEFEPFHTSNFDVAKLVKQMQENPPQGIEVKDRRWLARVHSKCFRGDELVNWLMRVFKDLQTREDATIIGNELMSRGIFSHVRHKHDFRDGNYFYQITSAHRTTDYPDTVNMFAKTLRSVPSTPMADSRGSPMLAPFSAHSDSGSSGKGTPQAHPQEKKQMLLSQMMLYDVDASKKSDQAEIVSLHYDRIHNPDNCYHIRLEWLNATAKLIREAIGRWSTVAENHGLRLVQMPLAEACKLPLQHPFDQPVAVRLAVRPPERVLSTPVLDPHTFSPRAAYLEDSIAYQKALLRKLDFVLDLEAAASFSTKLDIMYSWGRPSYDFTQFVHKSGRVLVQICNNEKGDFLLMPNRLASSKMSSGSKANEVTDVVAIVQGFVRFCRDEDALKAVYEEASRPRIPPPSPYMTSPLANAADLDVPPLSLPPHLMHRSALKGIQ